MGLSELWAVLRRKWVIILVTVLAVTAIAVFASAGSSDTFAAQSTVMLVDGLPSDVAGFLPTGVARHADRDFRTRTRLAISEEAALSAVEAIDYQGDAADLVSDLTAEEAVDKSTITFTVVDSDAAMAAAMVNAYADAYTALERETQEQRLESAILAAEKLAEARKAGITILDIPPDLDQRFVTDLTLGDIAYDNVLFLADRLKLAQVVQEDPVVVTEYAPVNASNDAETAYGMIAMGVVVGLLLGAMLALVAEYLDKRRAATTT